MRSTVKILIIFLLSFNTSYASDKIAYLDIDFILSKSNKGKLLLNELEKKK